MDRLCETMQRLLENTTRPFLRCAYRRIRWGNRIYRP